jgi:hypothetical protein
MRLAVIALRHIYDPTFNSETGTYTTSEPDDPYPSTLTLRLWLTAPPEESSVSLTVRISARDADIVRTLLENARGEELSCVLELGAAEGDVEFYFLTFDGQPEAIKVEASDTAYDRMLKIEKESRRRTEQVADKHDTPQCVGHIQCSGYLEVKEELARLEKQLDSQKNDIARLGSCIRILNNT